MMEFADWVVGSRVRACVFSMLPLGLPVHLETIQQGLRKEDGIRCDLAELRRLLMSSKRLGLVIEIAENRVVWSPRPHELEALEAVWDKLESQADSLSAP